MGNAKSTQCAVPPQPTAISKASYDELVIAEAKRRIAAEKQRQVTLAEKKRFEEDVAEQITLQKNPNHTTREMQANTELQRKCIDDEKIQQSITCMIAHATILLEKAELLIRNTATDWENAVADRCKYENYIWNGGMFDTFLLESYIDQIKLGVSAMKSIKNDLDIGESSSQTSNLLSEYSKQRNERYKMIHRFAKGSLSHRHRTPMFKHNAGIEHCKIQNIKADIQDLFGVLPEAVSTMRMEIEQLVEGTVLIKKQNYDSQK